MSKNKQMRRIITIIITTVLLFAVSGMFFYIQQRTLGRLHETAFLLLQDLIFLPIHVFLVTFLIDRIISRREKSERLSRMHVLINEFFAEAGEQLLHGLTGFIVNQDDAAPYFNLQQYTKEADFIKKAKSLSTKSIMLEADRGDLAHIYTLMTDKKENILRMLENEGILEHSAFTQMLWAVYHVLDELRNHGDLHTLTENDLQHLSVDLTRAYNHLLAQWLLYMNSLSSDYPYLYSLALRKKTFTDIYKMK